MASGGLAEDLAHVIILKQACTVVQAFLGHMPLPGPMMRA